MSKLEHTAVTLTVIEQEEAAVDRDLLMEDAGAAADGGSE